jgi:REP element-mobilizing transposase RayT
LHGAAPGSVDPTHNQPGTPFLPVDRAREQAMRERMKAPPYVLDEAARETVLAAIRERAADRGWRLWAVHVRSNHVHVVVGGHVAPEHMMMNFKAASSRALNESRRDAPDCMRWSRHGSTRYLFKKSAVEAAIRYTVQGQGEPMSVFVADAPAGRGSLADAVADVLALLQIPQPAPGDAECREILEDELSRKYGG